jgi:hypothetical protein
VSLSLTGTQPGVGYELIKDDATLVATLDGTGAAQSFGSSFKAGAYSVRTIETNDFCAVTMPGACTITESPVPGAPSMSNGSGCFSATVYAYAGTSGNGIRWSNGSTSSALGVSSSGYYYAVTTSAYGCVSPQASAYATVNGYSGNGYSASPCGCASGLTNCAGTCRSNRTYTQNDGACAATCGMAYVRLYNQCGSVVNSQYSTYAKASCTTNCCEYVTYSKKWGVQKGKCISTLCFDRNAPYNDWTLVSFTGVESPADAAPYPCMATCTMKKCY